jgi:NAD(P)-dependent dehydrogenase (short-subunit alcohol dehydrogenase family)
MPPQKWALITGVGVGSMGEGHLNAFLKRGVNVIATSIEMRFLENLDTVDGKNGAYVVKIVLDVTSPESIAEAVERVSKITGGRLDWLMSELPEFYDRIEMLTIVRADNAGYGYYMPLLDVDIDKAKKQYEVNVWGVLAVTQAFFPLLRVAKGTVVNQASIAGLQGFNRPYMGIYSSSKAAVYSLSDCLRVELAPFDIKVVTLVTGAVKTEFFNNKEGGRLVTLPDNSVYTPIRSHIETMLRGSLSGGKGHDRYSVTSSTVAAVMRWYWLRTRFVRRGYAAIKLWLMHMLLPLWLVDRWARQSGGLDQLRKMLREK